MSWVNLPQVLHISILKIYWKSTILWIDHRVESKIEYLCILNNEAAHLLGDMWRQAIVVEKEKYREIEKFLVTI